jgi:hypothetical protein
MLTIVGGGFTGLTVLSVMIKKGLDSKVYEATDSVGGILRDVISQNSNYFAGCQYLSTSSDLLNLSPSDDFLHFNQSFASYTDLFGKESISHEFSGPVFDGNLSFQDVRLNLEHSIYSKLIGYPSPVQEGLLNWMIKLGVDPRNFHAQSLKPLGVSRVHIRAHDDEVESMRIKDPKLSDYYGIPFTNHGLDMPAAVPRFGFSRYFDDTFVPNYKDSIFTRTSMKISYKAGSFLLKTNKALEIDSQRILWTGNPNPIFRSLGMEALDSFNFKCQLICGEVKNWNQEPFYVQVYSKNSKVLRIYLYELNGVGRFTVEKAYGSETIESTCEFVEQVLNKLEIKVKLEASGIWIQNRYNLFTLRDYESLVNLDLLLPNTNLLSGSWRKYGRDSKIAGIVADYFD